MIVRWIAERRDALALCALIGVPMLLTAAYLSPELLIPVPSNNDDATHFLLVQRASEALQNGENVIDHWVPQLELGFPWFIYYQPLPSLVVVLLHRALFGVVDLLTVFNLVRFALLVGLPLTVFWSLRRMGIAPFGAALGAAASPLLSGNFRYGLDYDSYVWRGFGMFTQLAAIHLSFATLGLVWEALRSRGRHGLAWAAFALAALVLSHLIYSYMIVIGLLALVVAGALSVRDAGRRAVRLAAIAIPAAAISAWLWLPFLAQQPYLGASPYLQREKYDSFGAPAILGWLASGDLLDHGRLPVVTLLLAVGLVAAAMTRTPIARAALALFSVWLVLYFGRPTLDGLVSLLPMSEGLLLHRFIGGVELAAIVLIGIGGAAAVAGLRIASERRRLVPAVAATLVLLAPAMAERARFYSFNTEWMQQTKAAIDADADARAILAAIRERPPGRVFAGLRSTGYGPQMGFGIPFNSVRFSDWLIFNGIPVVASPYSSVSLNADLFWDFTMDRPQDYQLLDVRYVVAPSGTAVPSFLRPALKTPRYALYEAPSTGYATYGAVIDRRGVPTQRDLFAVNRPWFNGADAAELRFHRFEFPAPAAVRPIEASSCSRPVYAYERAQQARIDVLVSCPEASTLVVKVTYHPNWHVTVDGREAPTLMVSPSYVAVALSAGEHFVRAEYLSTPAKAPLLGLGLATAAALLVASFWAHLAPIRPPRFAYEVRVRQLARFRLRR